MYLFTFQRKFAQGSNFGLSFTFHFGLEVCMNSESFAQAEEVKLSSNMQQTDICTLKELKKVAHIACKIKLPHLFGVQRESLRF